MDSFRLGEWTEPAPVALPKKKKKLGLLQRKTKEIEKRLAAIDAKAEAFRAKIARGEVPSVDYMEGK